MLEIDVNRLDYLFQTVKDRHSPTGKGWGTLGVFIGGLEVGAMHKPAISSSLDFSDSSRQAILGDRLTH